MHHRRLNQPCIYNLSYGLGRQAQTEIISVMYFLFQKEIVCVWESEVSTAQLVKISSQSYFR